MLPIRLTSLSDSHLGVNHIDSNIMTNNYRKLLFPYLDKSNIAVVSGDLIDSAIGLSDQPTMPIMAFLVDFLKYANDRGIIIRVLRGTYSHDRTQLEVLGVLHKHYGMTNDYRYFDVVSLEYIEALDMRVLYIPDNTPYKSSDEVMEVVAEQMRQLGWDYVDYAFVHGYFDFVLPEDPKTHAEVTFRKNQFGFVRRNVIIGHFHKHSASDNFFYNGSTDRLCHGEEEAKGFLYIEDDGKTSKVQFIENVNAAIFKTYKFDETVSDEYVTKMFLEGLDKLPKDTLTHARLIHPKPELRAALLKAALVQYPNVRVTHRAASSSKLTESFNELDIKLSIDTTSAPTEETLPDAIFSYITEQGAAITMSTDRIKELLARPME